MGESTGISWCHATFNPWLGCLKVSPGCERCYAETLVSTRFGLPVWGPSSTTPRQRTSAANWKKPLAWNRAAAKAGKRTRVFCASLADVFEDHPMVAPWRTELFALIEATPHLDWQLLTKRPENLLRMLPQSWLEAPRANVWLGTTVEDQKRASERIPHLLATPASVRFLSCEPLLEAVDLRHVGASERGPDFDALLGYRTEYGYKPRSKSECGIDVVSSPCARISWLIAGGESGPGARRFEAGWARSIVRQCDDAGVACFVKQMGAFVVDRNDAGFEAELETPPEPSAWPSPVEVIENINGYREQYQGADVRVRLKDRAGADPAEWPADLRIQQFPEVPRG